MERLPGDLKELSLWLEALGFDYKPFIQEAYDSDAREIDILRMLMRRVDAAEAKSKTRSPVYAAARVLIEGMRDRLRRRPRGEDDD